MHLANVKHALSLHLQSASPSVALVLPHHPTDSHMLLAAAQLLVGAWQLAASLSTPHANVKRGTLEKTVGSVHLGFSVLQHLALGTGG